MPKIFLSKTLYSLSVGSIVYADFHLLPGVVSSYSELPEISNYPIAAMTGLVNAEDNLGELFFVRGNGDGSGIWQSTGNYIELEDGFVSEQLWYVYKLDYASHLYDFFLNRILIAENVPFIDSSAIPFDQIQSETVDEEEVHFDRLTISHDRPTGLDHSSVVMSMNEMETVPQAEIKNGAQRLVQEISSAIGSININLYVNCTLGSDSYNGLCAEPGEPTSDCGPKASISSAFVAAKDLDDILLQPCTYNESVLDLKGKNLTIHLNGPVTIN